MRWWHERRRMDATSQRALLCFCLAAQLVFGSLRVARALEASSSGATGVPGGGGSSEVYLSSVEREGDSPTAMSDAPATSAEAEGGAQAGPTPRLAFLDKMLEQYDKRAWPTYGLGQPTYVKVNIYVNSIGPVNANNMEYGNGHLPPPVVAGRSAQREQVRRHHAGHHQRRGHHEQDMEARPVLQEREGGQLPLRDCPQQAGQAGTRRRGALQHAPHSAPRLLHVIQALSTGHATLPHPAGPYAQTIEQTAISWQDTDPIVLERPIEIPEFDLVHNSYGHYNRAIDTGVFSFLNATFTLERQNGYHLIQTYLPTFLIVMISWVSFWLNVDATPARVTLGVTTLLTMTTVASGVRTQLPPVSYIKAIDVWIGACSVMVFGALLEFTLVNYLSRSKLRPEEFRKSINIFNPRRNKTWDVETHEEERNRKANEKQDGEEGSNKYSSRGNMELQKNLKRSQNVDRVCRIMFPFVFFVFNVIYWFYYLYKSELT
ncbi:glutamate-gated chloride channel-like isoform X2 [Amblyomma americanum]